MERATVNVATGALGPVLQKLTALLVQDQYRYRFGDETRSDIELIKSELASMHSLLLRIWEREDLDRECMKWMVDARELSYDMEDGVDDFMLHSRRSRSSFETLILEFKDRVVDVSRRCRNEWRSAPHEAISSHRSKGTKDPRAGFLHRDASELVGMDKPKKQLLKLLQDHEMVCIHGLPGMGKTTLADLVYHEIGHEFQCRAFISLSKSPDMLEVLRAVLSQVTDGVQSSGSRSTKAATEENLSNLISNFLSDKRYLAIVDDIWHWEEWEIIRRALPEGVPRCRILATTRANAIAEKCRLTKFDNGGACIYRYGGINDEDAATLSKTVFNKELERTGGHVWRGLDDLTNIIARMCRGMPLAVECLSSRVFLSLELLYEYFIAYTEEGLGMLIWRRLVNGLRKERSRSLKPLAESLRLGYDDLPLYLKTCLLYCSTYPTGYLKIERHDLVRKWMAEGFVYHQAEGEEAAAALRMAEGWLDELVSRGLLQPESSEDNMQYYSVHPMMRAFLVCKSEQANFVAYFEDDNTSCYLDSVGRIRRLSVNFPGIPGIYIDPSQLLHAAGLPARSLVVFSYPSRHARDFADHWEQFENVRVLSIESRGFPLYYIDLVHICSRKPRLRYLGLKETVISDTGVSRLPKEIGNLQHLETLDASNSGVTELPKEIGKLRQLKTLNVSHTGVMELPREIGELQRLEALNVSHTSVRKLPREIGKLQHLKTLNVSHTSVMELPFLLSNSVIVFAGSKYPNKARKLSDHDLAVMRHFRKFIISSSRARPTPIEDLSIMLYDDSYQLHPVAGLKIVSRHMRVPEWVKQHLASVSTLDIRLCQLVDDDLDFLHNKMLYLQHLKLRLEVLPRKAIVITGAGFSMLESFCLDCRLPVVTFQQGAMPKLKHLEFKFYTSRALTSEDPMGICHLLSLKRVVFQSSPRYKSDAPGISAVINKVREEAKEHDNGITISINGEAEEVIQEKKNLKKAAVTSASDRTSEGSNITNNGGAGGSSGGSMIWTRPPIPYNDATDDEKGGNIIPVKSYYPFGITE